MSGLRGNARCPHLLTHNGAQVTLNAGRDIGKSRSVKHALGKVVLNKSALTTSKTKNYVGS